LKLTQSSWIRSYFTTSIVFGTLARYLSATIPQNPEQTLPHTQSSAIEPDEDERIDQECLLEIEPYGNE
jgi:hypothetical protein